MAKRTKSSLRYFPKSQTAITQLIEIPDTVARFSFMLRKKDISNHHRCPENTYTQFLQSLFFSFLSQNGTLSLYIVAVTLNNKVNWTSPSYHGEKRLWTSCCSVDQDSERWLSSKSKPSSMPKGSSRPFSLDWMLSRYQLGWLRTWSGRSLRREERFI